MKSRISVYVLLTLLLIAPVTVWFFFRSDTKSSTLVFPATVERDCAPWDGAAFTVSIPWNAGSTISISVYRSPEIKLPSSYSFPDETTSEGNAYLRMLDGSPKQLTGEVWLQRVSQEMPVEGSFRLMSESGAQFEGKFLAEWGDAVIYCG
jgi:hypothetical protein